MKKRKENRPEAPQGRTDSLYDDQPFKPVTITRRKLFTLAAGAGLMAAIPRFPVKEAVAATNDSGDVALAQGVINNLHDFTKSKKNSLGMDTPQGGNAAHKPVPNNVPPEPFEHAYDMPIVGFVRGDDPAVQALKINVAPFHMTPLELFKKVHPNIPCTDGDLTVISWVMPFTEKVKAEQRMLPDIYPSRRWGKGRSFGEISSDYSRQGVLELLSSKGYYAASAALTTHFRISRDSAYGFASTWSERHYAYCAGLGTFGLSDGLITPVGIAHRCASAIVKAKLPVTPRPYQSHRDYCLYFASGGQQCGICVKRCPAQAIQTYLHGVPGRSKVLCFKYISDVVTPYVKAKYPDNTAYTLYCARCQVNVPCESGIPMGIKIKNT